MRSGGGRTAPLSEEELDSLGLSNTAREATSQQGRNVNFMIYGTNTLLTARSANRKIPSK